MQGHFVYGEIDNTWLFLRVETADTLTRLWTALGEAKTWGEMRHAVGDRLVRMACEMTGFTQYPGDDAPFDAAPIVNEYNRSWSVEQLLQITANEIPGLSHLAETAESLNLLARYLSVASGAEPRIVLRLAEAGFLATRDDARIAQCLAVSVCPEEKSCVSPAQLG